MMTTPTSDGQSTALIESHDSKPTLDWKKIIWVVMIGAPFVALIIAMSQFNVITPFSDDLLMAQPLFNALQNHQLDSQFFFFQINEHMSTAPLLLATIATAFNIYPHLMLAANFVFAAAIVYAFYKLSTHTHLHLSRDERLLLTFTTSIFATSWLQWEIWSHASTVNLTMGNSAFILAVVAGSLAIITPKRLSLMIILCTIASFSVNIGFLSWVAILPLVIKNTRPSSRRLFIGIVLACGITAFSLYGYHYDTQLVLITKTSTLASPLTYLNFSAIAIGATLLPLYLQSTAILGGSMLLGVAIVLGRVIRQRHLFDKGYLPWVIILIYFLLTVAALALGRGGVNVPGRAFVSRYVIFVYPVIISWLYLTTKLYKPRPRLLQGFVIILVVLNMASGFLVLNKWQSRYSRLTTGKICTTIYESATDDCLELVGNSAQDSHYIKEQLHLFSQIGVINLSK